MYYFLNYFFVVFHSCFILFNLFGWTSRKMRRLHLLATGSTLLSWFVLGVFYGWGYCPSTQWHWQIKHALGEVELPDSYVKYYVDYLTGRSWDPMVVDAAVVISGVVSFVLSCWFNWRDLRSGGVT